MNGFKSIALRQQKNEIKLIEKILLGIKHMKYIEFDRMCQIK